MPYKVLIVIKNQWWSDQIALPTFSAAQRHRREVAARWSDCDTAILGADGQHVMAYRNSILEQKRFAEEIAK
jgi:hypothetical protein